jgi:hypothetical protein
MILRILADTVLVVHFSFIIFTLFGGLLALVGRTAIWFHIPVVLWSSVVNLAGWVCPLTPLENRLRELAGQAGYEGGFVEHYLMEVIYPGGMTRDLELTAGISVLVWNVLLYAYVLHRQRRKKSSGSL